jgi:N-methylhydantoinase A
VIGAHFLCERLKYRNVICTDVGGTTYDVAVIEDGRIVERAETHVAGRAIVGSMIDVTSIGAGGGSIAWLDHRNALQVGPRSAGASPGPACFRRGGVEATTTDAHLTLGWLDPEYFLGGRMKLDASAAHSAVERIGSKLELDVLATARGIVAIAENNMANAIREKTVARGLDPREFVMLAYGGGGGLFACPVAGELGIPKVIVPRAPANFSAWGILTSNYMEDEVLTRVMPFTESHIGEALRILRELDERVTTAIQQYGFDHGRVRILRRLDLRYSGQEYTLTVDLDEKWREASSVLTGARELFCNEHRRLYGHGDTAVPMELVAIRCRGSAEVTPPELSRLGIGTPAGEPRLRPVYFPGLQGSVMTPVVPRDSLGSGVKLQGPTIVEEWTTTTVVPPRWCGTVDDYGNLVLEPAV